MDIGVDALLSFGISVCVLTISTDLSCFANISKPDDRDPDSIVIFITPPRQIGLPSREYYNKTNTVGDYAAVMKEVLGNLSKNSTDLGSISNEELMEQIVADVVDFETKL